MEEWVNMQSKDFYSSGIKNLPDSWKFTAVAGDHTEKLSVSRFTVLNK